jgi:hypothetical protein
MSPTPISFGQVIPVTGPNLGFPGTVSRFGERVIAARQLVQQSASGTFNLNFGDPAVLVENNSGGDFTSVADFINAATSNISLVAAQFAGIAVREVQTQLVYPAGQTPGILQVGYYAPNTMSEVLERGSATILLSVGSPVSGSQLYTRAVLNGAVTAGLVGDWETTPAASDLFTDVTPTGTVNTTALTITNTNIQVGQVVSGPGIAPGTYVTAYTPGTATLSKALTLDVIAGQAITFSNLIALPNVVARTGFVDANSILEVTIKVRNAA